MNDPLNVATDEPLIDTVFPLANAGLGADASVTVAVVALRVIDVIVVPGVPVPSSAAVMPALLVAKGVAERLLPAAQPVVQV